MAGVVLKDDADDQIYSVSAGEKQKYCLPPTCFPDVSKFYPADFHHIEDNITCWRNTISRQLYKKKTQYKYILSN